MISLTAAHVITGQGGWGHLVLVLTPSFHHCSLSVGHVFAMIVAGDVFPFLLQMMKIIGQVVLISVREKQHIYINLLHIVALASVIRSN